MDVPDRWQRIPRLHRNPLFVLLLVVSLLAGMLADAVNAPAPVANAAAANSINTVAGGGSLTGDDVSAFAPSIDPQAVAVDGSGDLFTMDGNRVREVPATSGTQFGITMTEGNIYTVAGNGTLINGPFLSASVLATSAPLSEPVAGGLVVDSAGDVFISESGPRDGGWVQEVANVAGSHFGIAMQADYIYTVAGAGAGEHRVTAARRYPPLSQADQSPWIARGTCTSVRITSCGKWPLRPVRTSASA